MLPASGYTVCPGIPSFPAEVRFKPKKYWEWKLPFVRHDSKGCKFWYVSNHCKRSIEDPLYDSCPSCKLLWLDLGTLAKPGRLTSPSIKAVANVIFKEGTQVSITTFPSSSSETIKAGQKGNDGEPKAVPKV